MTDEPVEKSVWRLCRLLKRERELTKSDSFTYSPADAEQEKLLNRLATDGVVEYQGNAVSLQRPAFDDYLDTLEQIYGMAPIWLDKDYKELRLCYDVAYHRVQRLLYIFRPQQQPDLLMDYLIEKADGRIVTRKELVEEGIITARNLDFKRVMTEQVGFTPLLIKVFIKVLDTDRIQLLPRSEISYDDLAKLERHLSSLKFPEDARHKNVHKYRLPDF